MFSGLLRALARIRITVAYAVTLTAVTTAMAVLGPRAQDRIVRHASTNLHNLCHGRIGTLFVSAFVVDAGPIIAWLPGLACLLALAELLWRSGRLVTSFVVGHIGATLLVAVGLTAAVAIGVLSTDVTRATDVGMSYGAAAVLGALSARCRAAVAACLVRLVDGGRGGVVAVGGDFTDLGHAVALLLGILVSSRFGPPGRWTPARYLLLVVASAFGYLMLANGSGRGRGGGVRCNRRRACRGRSRQAVGPPLGAASRRDRARTQPRRRVTSLSFTDHL